MASNTIHDRLLTALLASGGKVCPDNKSRKYTKVLYKDNYLWLGKAGALRMGLTVTGSIPVERLKHVLLTEPVS